MREFILALVLLGMADAVVAQPYVPTPYAGSPSAFPSTVPPGPPSGYALPGFNWREDRGDADWRNNTWRENRFDEDWRNRNWQTRRELQDWRERQDYSKGRNPDNPFDQGYVECGKGSVGLSSPCAGYVKQRTREKTETAAQGDQRSEDEKQKNTQRGVANCGHGAVWRRCQ